MKEVANKAVVGLSVFVLILSLISVLILALCGLCRFVWFDENIHSLEYTDWSLEKP